VSGLRIAGVLLAVVASLGIEPLAPDPHGPAWSDAMSRGEKAWAAGDREGAATAWGEAVEIARASGPPGLRLGRSLDDFALALHRLGRYEEAEAVYREAIALWRKVLGPDQPRLGTTLHNFAAMLIETGRTAEAEPLLAETVDLWERRLGPGSPDLARALRTWAVVLRREGRDEEAAGALVRADAIDGGNAAPATGTKPRPE